MKRSLLVVLLCVAVAAGFLVGKASTRSNGAGATSGSSRNDHLATGPIRDFMTESPQQPPASRTMTVTLRGGVPLEMVYIPAGSFLMGSPEDERGRLDIEGPQTHVTITRGFWMGKYPVTQRQWEAMSGTGNWPGSPPTEQYGRGNNHPMYYVSWYDAQAFVDLLNNYFAATDQNLGTFRLPTEAEWEYAARAGTTTRFSFGDSLETDDDCTHDYVRAAHMWYCNFASSSHPVGQKLPNPWGLYDMNGNVSEWCADWYWSSYPGGSVSDPQGPDSSRTKTLRGGPCNGTLWACRSAGRLLGLPTNRWSSIGFRLVMEH